MTFIHPWMLVWSLAPLGCVAYAWSGTTRRRLGLMLKALSVAAIIVALSEPVITMPQTKTGVVVLLDTSASASDKDLRREASLVSEMSSDMGGNWMRVVPFARRTRDLKPEETTGELRITRTLDDEGQGTDLEAAIREGISAVPAGRIPKLVLVSDGKENEGSSARAITQAQRLHIPIDTFALDGRSSAGLRLLSVSMPHQAYAAEQVPIDLTVQSPVTGAASVTIEADGRVLGQDRVALNEGINQVHVHTRVNTNGATPITGRVTLDSGGTVEFEQAIDLQRPRALYISEDPAGAESNFIRALKEAQFDVDRDPRMLEPGLGTGLSDVQLVILNNLDFNLLTLQQKQNLEVYVKNGGGLLVVGGEKQVYKDEKRLDALDRALPAKLAPPKTPEGLCVAIIIDKSSSMEGRKIELARLSAIGVVDHLRPADLIGVLIFDNSFQWAVPLRRAEDKSLIKRLVSGITPDGGTQIAPALAEAYRRVSSTHSSFKHIVLLTDGISEEGDSFDLAKQALAHQVTISTVGLGQDVNRGYLERVAALSGGRSYFLNDPQGLQQILLKDVMEYTGSTAVERPLKAIVDNKTEILDGIPFDSAPPLKGYTRYVAKPTAETILSIDESKKDPLYVRWQYGLGRAAVFTSDAKSRWAADWLRWPGFDKFWINVTRDLLPHSQEVEADPRFDPATGDLVVDYHLGPGVPEPAEAPAIYVLGPDGFEKPLPVSRIAAGIYRGRLHIGERRGLFRIRPLAATRAFPEAGLYRRQDEMLDYGSNTGLLKQISSLTGGEFNPSIANVFRSSGRYIPEVWHLWPAMLGLAIALSLAELAARKWRGIFRF
jgi:Ca-activated chloride channel homolog